MRYRVPRRSVNCPGRGNHLARGDRVDDSTPRMKTCTKCSDTLAATPEFFGRQSENKDGLRGRCRRCRCADKAAAYRVRRQRELDARAAARQAARREKARAYAAPRKARNLEFIRSIRADCRCESCGTADNLHFHHRDPSSLKFRLAHPSGRSITTIHAELAKCSVLCVSCHARLHHEDRRCSRLTCREAVDVGPS